MVKREEEAEKKQKFRHYIWCCSEQDCSCSKNYISILDFNPVFALKSILFLSHILQVAFHHFNDT